MESISKQRHTSYVITEYEVYMSSAIDTIFLKYCLIDKLLLVFTWTHH
jgi:hypothetical protein